LFNKLAENETSSIESFEAMTRSTIPEPKKVPTPLEDTFYEYRIIPRGMETLVNMLMPFGIDLRSHYYGKVNDEITFTSKRLIDLKPFKKQNVIRSYKIVKVLRICETIEQG
jgi:hypothetical protein